MLGLPSNIDELMALGPEELALRMLPFLHQALWEGGLTLDAYLERVLGSYQTPTGPQPRKPYPIHMASDVKEVIIEAWTWLEGQALLVPASTLAQVPARRLSRTGRRLAATNPEGKLKGRSLRKESLWPSLRDEVWLQFHRGHFDTAVFVAMKTVEIAVREAGRFSPTDIGVDLMRKAFHPTSGPLADKAATTSEREARANLFAGVIGSYKNPQSHRKVDLSNPDEAAEIIMLASHLLRIVLDQEIKQLFN